jgi:nitronate monooxygenase
MKTFREHFRTDLPVIQAPMAGVQGSALAIAVSNAGGLGSLPCAMLTPDQIGSELTAIRAHTSGPINVNFFCHAPPQPDPAREEAWIAALAPYYKEFGIPQTPSATAASRTPFSDASADVIEPFRPEIVSFHFGLPSPALLSRVKSFGAKILSSATTLDEALWLEQRGVDAIIAQGIEAGGHRGSFLSEDLARQPSAFDLLRQILGKVKIPVIAAGGIANAESVREALDLGAFAVQIGTAYLLCPEATTPPLHRAALRNKAVRQTAVTNLFSGRPARGIVNRLMRDLGPMSQLPPAFPLAASALAPLRAKAEAQGDDGFSTLWCGESQTECHELPAAEITKSLCADATVRTR